MECSQTPFGFASTAEVTAGVDLAGRRVAVTGASSGTGAGGPLAVRKQYPTCPPTLSAVALEQLIQELIERNLLLVDGLESIRLE